jgi:hypothetical protein
VAEGEGCGLRVPRAAPLPAPWPFDVALVGTLDSDEHPVFGRGFFPDDGTLVGASRFYAPLRHMSEAGVLEAVSHLGLPLDALRYGGDVLRDPDTYAACTRCLTGVGRVFCPDVRAEIEAVSWDRPTALNNFKTRFTAR